jgi:DNA polymerase-3 subunit delta
MYSRKIFSDFLYSDQKTYFFEKYPKFFMYYILNNLQENIRKRLYFSYEKLEGKDVLMISKLDEEERKFKVEFEISEKLKDYQLSAWVDSYCKQQKIAITPKANAMLCEYLGTDLQRVANEISKLLLNKKVGDAISEDDVRTNIGISKDYNVFELQAALSAKNVLKANQIIIYFSLNLKEHPTIMTIATLFSYFSKLLLYHSLPDKSGSSVASTLKVNPYFVKDYEAASKKYSPDKIMRIIGYLRESDATVKGVDSTDIDDIDLLKELIFKILH